MTALSARLRKLEEINGDKVYFRFVTIHGGPSTEAEVKAFLITQGIELQPTDMLLFRSIYEPGENGPVIAAVTAASVDGRTGSFQLGTIIEDDVVEAFLDGRTYVEIRTESHPDGELRAQLR